MKGTEKQIAWANEIIKDWQDHIYHLIDTAKQRVEDGDYGQWYADFYEEKGLYAIKQLTKTEDRNAKEIIENRTNHMGIYFGLKMVEVLKKELAKRKEWND
jgi:hypothetical protein